MTKRSRVVIGLIALGIMTVGVGGFLAKAQISAIMTKSPARDRPMQRAQEEVIAAFNQIEKAMREGDATLFLALTSRKAFAGGSDAIKAGYRPVMPKPGIRLEPIAVCVRAESAFVVAKYDDPANKDTKSYLVRYVREDGAWKIVDQTTSASPPYRPAIYAFLPPEGGAFTHAGLPWRTIGYANSTAKALPDQPFWKIQATRDETFLYVRFEAMASLPALGSDISPDDLRLMNTEMSADPPVMVVTVTRPDDNQTLVKSSFEFQVARRFTPRASRDAGKAESKRTYLGYSLVVRGDRDETLFDSSVGAFNRLIEVRDRFIDVRIPLKSLDLHGRGAPDIEVKELDALPQARPYKVARFSP